MRCPFNPGCEANLDPPRSTAGEDPSSIVLFYPVHDIVGPFAWHGRCPGGGTRVMLDGRVHESETRRLVEATEILFRRSYQRSEEQLDEQRELAEFDAFADQAEQTIREILDDDSHRLVDRDAPDAPFIDCAGTELDGRLHHGNHIGCEHDWRRHGEPGRGRRKDQGGDAAALRERDLPPGAPLGRGQTAPDDAYPEHLEQDDDEWPTPSEFAEFNASDGMPLGDAPSRPAEEYYPGRPADVPEPGRGDPAAAIVPLDQGRIGMLGRAAMENARDQLKALLTAAIDQLGQTQDTLAKATASTETIGSFRIACEQSLQAAQSLVNVAIGQGGDYPRVAEQLQAQLVVARQNIVEADGILGALTVLSDRITAAFEQVNGAITAAEEYRSIP